MLIGIRFGLEPGRGRAAQPVRPSLLGSIAGVAGIVAALTFADGVRDAADNPARYGQTFQLGGFFGQSGHDYYPTAAIARLVGRSPDVAGVGDIREAVATAAGGSTSVSLFTMRPVAKPLRVVVTAGRLPAAPDEVLLAPHSLAALHAPRLGSWIALAGNRTEARYRVVGVGFVPQGAPNQVYFDGGWLTGAGFDRIFQRFRFHFLALAVREGQDPAAVGRQLTKEIATGFHAQLDFNVPAPPLEILQLRQVESLPTVLGVFLAVLAAGAMGHALAVAVRRRAGELAVLRALGMTPRQCRLALITHACVIALVGLVVGVPVGVALGRSVWRAVAHYTPLEYVPPTATPVLVLCVPLALLLAYLLAALPARRAARLHIADVLRTE